MFKRSTRAHGVVVSHPLSMREALGSIPSVNTLAIHNCAAGASGRYCAKEHSQVSRFGNPDKLRSHTTTSSHVGQLAAAPPTSVQ